MTVTYHDAFEQGSDAWLAARCGLLTASEMHLILTPTFRLANNDKSRGHMMELLSQRITGYVEPSYISDAMLRGMEDEIEARALYAKHYAPVTECGFVTNDALGFRIGYSPDGLVGDDGLIEIKSRRQKFQVETAIRGEVPPEFMLQCQTGLLVTGREWIDFISYSAGLPMLRLRVTVDNAIADAIVEAAQAFEASLADALADYETALIGLGNDALPTERKILEEMHL